MGFSVCSAASSSDSGVLEETIAAIASGDAFVADIITYLCAGGSEKAGGYWQKLYIETFSAFLLIAFAQLTLPIGADGEDWCPEELRVFSLSIHAPQNPFPCPFQSKSTAEVYIPSLNKRLVAVSSQCYSEYITS